MIVASEQISYTSVWSDSTLRARILARRGRHLGACYSKERADETREVGSKHYDNYRQRGSLIGDKASDYYLRHMSLLTISYNHRHVPSITIPTLQTDAGPEQAEDSSPSPPQSARVKTASEPPHYLFPTATRLRASPISNRSHPRTLTWTQST